MDSACQVQEIDNWPMNRSRFLSEKCLHFVHYQGHISHSWTLILFMMGHVPNSILKNVAEIFEDFYVSEYVIFIMFRSKLCRNKRCWKLGRCVAN